MSDTHKFDGDDPEINAAIEEAQRRLPEFQRALDEDARRLIPAIEGALVKARFESPITHAIEHRSEDVLQVEHGSLYPALHRLEDRGWIAAFWGTSENNRRARYYRLTPKGRAQLVEQTNRWDALVRAINRIVRPATE